MFVYEGNLMLRKYFYDNTCSCLGCPKDIGTAPVTHVTGWNENGEGQGKNLCYWELSRNRMIFHTEHNLHQQSDRCDGEGHGGLEVNSIRNTNQYQKPY